MQAYLPKKDYLKKMDTFFAEQLLGLPSCHQNHESKKPLNRILVGESPLPTTYIPSEPIKMTLALNLVEEYVIRSYSICKNIYIHK